MRTRDLLQSALTGLTRNLLRSLLTTLGIIIGVGSVVLMLSVGNSFQRYILDQVSTFSGNTFEVHPQGLEQFGKDLTTIKNADLEALERLSTVQSVAPVIFIPQRISYAGKDVTPLVFGTTKEIFHNFSLTLDRGRFLTDADVKAGSPVAVIASQTATDLFPNTDPLGHRLTIGSSKFTVVGVLKSFGSPLASSLDTVVYVPISVARAVTGNTSYVDYISLQSTGMVSLTQADVTSLLRQRHKISNPGNDTTKDDFVVRSFQQATQIIGTVTLSITIFLGLIAGISLVVGGIGIMNIMLVSVTERTREIGLRKALGARQRDILLQFLVEAVSLTLFGGIVGLGGGLWLAFVIALAAGRFLAGFHFALSVSAVVLSLTMAASIGLLFGIYPAKRAAQLDPIEALRFE